MFELDTDEISNKVPQWAHIVMIRRDYVITVSKTMLLCYFNEMMTLLWYVCVGISWGEKHNSCIHYNIQ